MDFVCKLYGNTYAATCNGRVSRCYHIESSFTGPLHPEVTSCLLSRGKTKYATLGMRLWCKYIRNYLLVYQLISHFLPYLRNYKEFEGLILDLQLEKYGLSFETKKYTTSGWARGDENVIGIRAFKELNFGQIWGFGTEILRKFRIYNGKFCKIHNFCWKGGLKELKHAEMGVLGNCWESVKRGS